MLIYCLLMHILHCTSRGGVGMLSDPGTIVSFVCVCACVHVCVRACVRVFCVLPSLSGQ